MMVNVPVCVCHRVLLGPNSDVFDVCLSVLVCAALSRLVWGGGCVCVCVCVMHCGLNRKCFPALPVLYIMWLFSCFQCFMLWLEMSLISLTNHWSQELYQHFLIMQWCSLCKKKGLTWI